MHVSEQLGQMPFKSQFVTAKLSLGAWLPRDLLHVAGEAAKSDIFDMPPIEVIHLIQDIALIGDTFPGLRNSAMKGIHDITHNWLEAKEAAKRLFADLRRNQV